MSIVSKTEIHRGGREKHHLLSREELWSHLDSAEKRKEEEEKGFPAWPGKASTYIFTKKGVLPRGVKLRYKGGRGALQEDCRRKGKRRVVISSEEVGGC